VLANSQARLRLVDTFDCPEPETAVERGFAFVVLATARFAGFLPPWARLFLSKAAKSMISADRCDVLADSSGPVISLV